MYSDPILNAVPFVISDKRLLIEDILSIATHHQTVELCQDEAYRNKLKKGHQFLDKLIQEDGHIYGVTTGYGDSCTRGVPSDLVNSLPLHLQRFHGCGLGAYFSPVMARGIVAVRITSLAKGFSGVHEELLERLITLLNHNIVPVIPEEGSVGASGDLTPLSYIAGMLCGERDVYDKGQQTTALQAFKRIGMTPYTLKPKEGLAIMNGTAVMTALACFAFDRAEYVMKLCTRLTAMASLVLKGNPFHFDEVLFSVKPHSGQIEVAKRIRIDLQTSSPPRHSERLQDRYSLRCAPHIIGVLADTLPWLRQMIENELNSANDNPIIDGEGEHILHGGHFYGGHIALAMDTLKTCVANLADLMDRQMALLVDTKYNNGLPSNLSACSPDRRPINHGFKAVQIGMSAWTAEALKLTMPASVFSRSTECHNQDKVSMGTHAARDCLRILQLTEQVASALTLAVSQAYEIRIGQGEITPETAPQALAEFAQAVMSDFDLVTEDRPLEHDLRRFIDHIQRKKWNLYPDEQRTEEQGTV